MYFTVWITGVSKAICGSGTQKLGFQALICACCLSDEKKDRQMNPIHDRQFIACLSSLLEGREFTALGAGKPKCFVCRVSFSAETPESMPFGIFEAGSCFFLCAQTARNTRCAGIQDAGCRLPQIVRRTAKIRGGG